MRGRRLLVSGLTILLLLASGMAVFAFTRSLQMSTRWTGMGICSVSMTSPTEGWAVGDITGPSSTLLLHYTAGHWTVVAPPAGLDRMAELSAVAMASMAAGRTTTICSGSKMLCAAPRG